MATFDNSEFKLAWAKVVARASIEAAFRTRLVNDSVGVFAEYGVVAVDKDELDAYLRDNLKRALDLIEQQRSQQQSAQTQSGANVFHTTGCGGDPCFCATQATHIPCWATPNLQSGGANSGGRGNNMGTATTFTTGGGYCGCMCSGTIVATAATSGNSMMSTQLGGAATAASGGAVGTDAGARFNCLGSVGSAGSFGSWCGTAGSLATAGTFGSAVANNQLAAAAGAGTFGGGTMQSTQLGGAATAASGGAVGTDAGARFNCLGSVGSAGSFGSWCGTAGSLATAGTFGSALTQLASAPGAGAFGGGTMQSTQLGGAASAGVNSGATLGSFATYCGCIGGSNPYGGPASVCWGTLACS
jgi:hypothetical protein